MPAQQLKQLVERYFAAVDNKDLSTVLSFFTPDATFTIATYQSTFKGRDTEISEMFERLFSRYDKILHSHFDHFPSLPDRISSRFEVQNSKIGSPTIYKNNCNFFKLQGNQFHEVYVYMSGDNALA
jgi:3-phenylpropionate/cinnamic acid dioxygenase small subunit